VIALTFSRFASMLFIDTRHLRTFPLVIPNTHFSGFSLSLASHMFAKVSAKSERYFSFSLLTTTMSST
jgi:hypothetical protein